MDIYDSNPSHNEVKPPEAQDLGLRSDDTPSGVSQEHTCPRCAESCTCSCTHACASVPDNYIDTPGTKKATPTVSPSSLPLLSLLGAISFSTHVHLEPSIMRDWEPDRISALFHGITLILAAQSGMKPEGE
jgi:hypothetical protein